MTHRFAELAFTPAVRAIQESMGSRKAYAKAEGGPLHHDRLGDAERDFIATRDSFYLATVSETGWPYIQHRGGPPGFVRVLDEKTLGFADFRGNRQYITRGNLAGNDRVALFFMDYPRQARLKLLGRARPVAIEDDPGLAATLAMPGYPRKSSAAFSSLSRRSIGTARSILRRASQRPKSPPSSRPCSSAYVSLKV
jgi:uncharacterized protein